MSKIYDIIVFGASGFTGSLVAEYLYNQYGVDKGLKWAIAGRNKEKLEETLSQLNIKAVPIVIADGKDASSLLEMAKQTSVVCNVAGPYSRFGHSVIEACIKADSHYCDLSGEVPFMHRTVKAFHNEAKEAKLKIVHSCGFDSIPSDFGVAIIQNAFYNKYGKYATQVMSGLKAASGKFSGGTFASLNGVIEEASTHSEVRKMLTNPYSLCANHLDTRQPNINTIYFDDTFNSWMTPFIMASINTKIVLRSHELNQHPYGKAFAYGEYTQTGKGMSGKFKSYTMALIAKALTSTGSIMNSLKKTFLPKPGEGPDRQAREKGFFYFQMYAKGKDQEVMTMKIKGKRDPGYGCTSRMLGETAVALCKDELPATYGILTPTTALGLGFENRLAQQAEVSFNIQS